MVQSIPRRSTRYDPLMRVHNRENIDWYNGWAEATEALWVRYCITQCPKACQDGFGLYRIIQGLIVLRCAPSASGFPLHVSQNQHQRHAARPALGSVVWNGGMYAHSHAFALRPRTLFKACSSQGPAHVCFKCPPPSPSALRMRPVVVPIARILCVGCSAQRSPQYLQKPSSSAADAATTARRTGHGNLKRKRQHQFKCCHWVPPARARALRG